MKFKCYCGAVFEGWGPEVFPCPTCGHCYYRQADGSYGSPSKGPLEVVVPQREPFSQPNPEKKWFTPK